MIGSGALMLQSDYNRGTKDSDILETASLTPEIRERLLQLGGIGTTLHKKHSMYVEIVAHGLPFLPQSPNWIEQPELNGILRNFEVEALDVVDVVVSKLKRFNSNDDRDIEAMIEKDLVPHEALLDRFRRAIDSFAMDARAIEIPRYVANLHRIERDYFYVAETPIEIPDCH